MHCIQPSRKGRRDDLGQLEAIEHCSRCGRTALHGRVERCAQGRAMSQGTRSLSWTREPAPFHQTTQPASQVQPTGAPDLSPSHHPAVQVASPLTRNQSHPSGTTLIHAPCPFRNQTPNSNPTHVPFLIHSQGTLSSSPSLSHRSTHSSSDNAARNDTSYTVHSHIVPLCILEKREKLTWMNSVGASFVLTGAVVTT